MKIGTLGIWLFLWAVTCAQGFESLAEKVEETKKNLDELRKETTNDLKSLTEKSSKEVVNIVKESAELTKQLDEKAEKVAADLKSMTDKYGQMTLKTFSELPDDDMDKVKEIAQLNPDELSTLGLSEEAIKTMKEKLGNDKDITAEGLRKEFEKLKDGAAQTVKATAQQMEKVKNILGDKKEMTVDDLAKMKEDLGGMSTKDLVQLAKDNDMIDQEMITNLMTKQQTYTITIRVPVSKFGALNDPCLREASAAIVRAITAALAKEAKLKLEADPSSLWEAFKDATTLASKVKVSLALLRDTAGVSVEISVSASVQELPSLGKFFADRAPMIVQELAEALLDLQCVRDAPGQISANIADVVDTDMPELATLEDMSKFAAGLANSVGNNGGNNNNGGNWNNNGGGNNDGGNNGGGWNNNGGGNNDGGGNDNGGGSVASAAFKQIGTSSIVSSFLVFASAARLCA